MKGSDTNPGKGSFKYRKDIVNYDNRRTEFFELSVACARYKNVTGCGHGGYGKLLILSLVEQALDQAKLCKKS